MKNILFLLLFSLSSTFAFAQPSMVGKWYPVKFYFEGNKSVNIDKASMKKYALDDFKKRNKKPISATQLKQVDAMMNVMIKEFKLLNMNFINETDYKGRLRKKDQTGTYSFNWDEKILTIKEKDDDEKTYPFKMDGSMIIVEIDSEMSLGFLRK
jgi:hypothetical protein